MQLVYQFVLFPSFIHKTICYEYFNEMKKNHSVIAYTNLNLIQN
jgi:hypothetical protein